VVAYDLRIAGEGLPLCAAVGHASLDPDQIAVLRAAEQGLARWIAIGRLRPPSRAAFSEEVLMRGERHV
jgi:hypothetical protein